jgi:hypothetical protein
LKGRSSGGGIEGEEQRDSGAGGGGIQGQAAAPLAARLLADGVMPRGHAKRRGHGKRMSP